MTTEPEVLWGTCSVALGTGGVCQLPRLAIVSVLGDFTSHSHGLV